MPMKIKRKGAREGTGLSGTNTLPL